MKTSYHLVLTQFQTIYELPGSWEPEDYRNLLGLMDFEGASDVPEEELPEMCSMALTDLSPEEAAALVIGYVMPERFKPAQISNLAHEIQEENLWEEHPDLALHEAFFKITHLLFRAFENTFPKPEALRFHLRLGTVKTRDLAWFKKTPEAPLVRLLLQGMPDNTKIRRLFPEKLVDGPFPEAADILWQCQLKGGDENSLEFDIISSAYWFQDLRYHREFEGLLEQPSAEA